jgi:hypothetical protein
MSRKLRLLIFGCTVGLSAADLTNAVVIGPQSKAVEMLIDEVAARTQGLRWKQAQSGTPAIRITLGSGPGGGLLDPHGCKWRHDQWE